MFRLIPSCIPPPPRAPPCARECVIVCVCVPAWLCICASLFRPVKSCYHTQQHYCSPPIHPLWRNSLRLLAHMIAPHCSCLLLWARPDSRAEKQRRPPSPTPAFSIVYCGQAGEYVTKTMAQSNRLGPKCRETNCSEEKGWLVSLFPLFPPSWLIRGVKLTVGDSLEEVEVQPERCTWMKVTVQHVRADAVNGQWANSLSAVPKTPQMRGPFFSWVHPFYKHVTSWCNKGNESNVPASVPVLMLHHK